MKKNIITLCLLTFVFSSAAIADHLITNITNNENNPPELPFPSASPSPNPFSCMIQRTSVSQDIYECLQPYSLEFNEVQKIAELGQWALEQAFGQPWEYEYFISDFTGSIRSAYSYSLRVAAQGKNIDLIEELGQIVRTHILRAIENPPITITPVPAPWPVIQPRPLPVPVYRCPPRIRIIHLSPRHPIPCHPIIIPCPGHSHPSQPPTNGGRHCGGSHSGGGHHGH